MLQIIEKNLGNEWDPKGPPTQNLKLMVNLQEESYQKNSFTTETYGMNVIFEDQLVSDFSVPLKLL